MKTRRWRSRGVKTAAALSPDPPGTSRAGTPAFETLYRENRDALYAYVASLLRDSSLAEDVTATAFERAYRRRHSFDPARGEARGWLFGIARNAALDELRRHKRRADLQVEPADLGSPPLDQAAEAAERRLILQGALNQLGGPDRELIALRYFADLSLAEIAATLGITETNAGTRVHRALAKLRRNLDGLV